MNKEIKQDKVMELVVSFSGKTFSNSKEAYSWLDKNVRELLKAQREDLLKKIEGMKESNGYKCSGDSEHLAYCGGCCEQFTESQIGYNQALQDIKKLIK